MKTNIDASLQNKINVIMVNIDSRYFNLDIDKSIAIKAQLVNYKSRIYIYNGITSDGHEFRECPQPIVIS